MLRRDGRHAVTRFRCGLVFAAGLNDVEEMPPLSTLRAFADDAEQLALI
jgi:hypothetical protein